MAAMDRGSGGVSSERGHGFSGQDEIAQKFSARATAATACGHVTSAIWSRIRACGVARVMSS
jgi:hypothetical protein